MNKQRLRFLSIGFLLSALILSGFQLFYPMDSPAENADTTANVASDGYKEKYESLLVEVELQKKAAESAAVTSSDTSLAESVPEATASQAVATSESSAGTMVKFVIAQGQPTSVVIDNLVSAGLIADRAVFEQYLTEHNLLYKINYGEYELSRDMGYEVIADIITLE
jgi:hypothetical protein